MYSFNIVFILGPYFYPSLGVVKIVEATEIFIRKLMYTTNNILPSHNLVQDIIVAVSRQLIEKLRNLFPTHEEHQFSLMKNIINCYCKIRLHNLGRMYSEKLQETAIRKTLSKLILFKHQ